MKRHYASLFFVLVICFLTVSVFFSLDKSLMIPKSEAASHRIEVVLKAKHNPQYFWRIVEQGVDVAAEEFNLSCHVVGPEEEKNVEQQIMMMEEAIKNKPEAIILAAADYERLVPVCEKAVKQGIKLVTIDSDVNYEGKSCYIASDNYKIGEKLAELVEETIGKDEKFGVIGHIETAFTAIERYRGLEENVYNAGERIAAVDYCEGLESIARERTIEMIKAHPEIKCIVGLNESSSLGAADALVELGLQGKIKLLACDSSEKQIKYMETGTIEACVIQHTFNMGYLSVKAAVDVLEGREVERTIDTGSLVVTRENLYNQENQKLLFPFTSA